MLGEGGPGPKEGSQEKGDGSQGQGTGWMGERVESEQKHWEKLKGMEVHGNIRTSSTSKRNLSFLSGNSRACTSN